MVMPFGKHKGWEIEDLPDDYVHWLFRTVPDLRWIPCEVQSSRSGPRDLSPSGTRPKRTSPAGSTMRNSPF